MTMLYPMFANHHIKHQATSKLGSQPRDTGGNLNLLQGSVLVCTSSPQGLRSATMRQFE